MTEHLGLVISKHPGEAGAGLKDLADGFFVPAQMNNGGVVTEDDIVRLSRILSRLFPAQVVVSTFQVYITELLMITDVSQILTVNIQRVLVIRVDLTEHAPIHNDFKGGLGGFFSQII